MQNIILTYYFFWGSTQKYAWAKIMFNRWPMPCKVFIVCIGRNFYENKQLHKKSCPWGPVPYLLDSIWTNLHVFVGLHKTPNVDSNISWFTKSKALALSQKIHSICIFALILISFNTPSINLAGFALKTPCLKPDDYNYVNLIAKLLHTLMF